MVGREIRKRNGSNKSGNEQRFAFGKQPLPKWCFGVHFFAVCLSNRIDSMFNVAASNTGLNIRTYIYARRAIPFEQPVVKVGWEKNETNRFPFRNMKGKWRKPMPL